MCGTSFEIPGLIESSRFSLPKSRLVTIADVAGVAVFPLDSVFPAVCAAVHQIGLLLGEAGCALFDSRRAMVFVTGLAKG